MVLFKDCQSRGGLSLDSLAAWAVRSTDYEPFQPWIGDYLMAISSFEPDDEMSLFDTNVLRFWGNLEPQVLSELKRGNAVSLLDLGPDAKNFLYRMVFCDRQEHMQDDPTDVLPNGITGGFLRVKVSEVPVFQAWSSITGPPVATSHTDAATLGRALARGKASFGAYLDGAASWDQFRMGVSRTYELQFSLLPGNVPFKVSLGESLVDPTSEVISQLPDAVKAEVEKVKADTIARPRRPFRKGTIPPL
jgi:hypothetical protein